MKKIFAAIICVAFMFSLSACGAKENSTVSNDYDITNYNYSDGLDENGFFEGITASDYVNVPDYKNLEIPEETLTASEDDIQTQIDSILESLGSTYVHITDRAVVDGDSVNIDYVGSIDGVEFSGGSTGGYGKDVTIGVTNYIDDFLEQLIGHMPGETFNIEATFPEDYGQEDLNGKDAVFVTTINYINGEEIEPELTDEVASQYGFETVDELKADIAAWLIEQQKSEYFNEFINQATAKGDVPQAVIDWVIYSDIAYYQSYADMYSMTLDEFLLNNVGYTDKADYLAQNEENFKSAAVTFLAVQAIAEAEGLTVTDEDVSDAGMSDYIEYYGMPYLKQYVLQTVTIPNVIFGE